MPATVLPWRALPFMEFDVSKKSTTTVPGPLVDVSLIDGPQCAAAGGESISKFLEGVRRTAAGELHEGDIAYPQPVIRRPRFTRWRMADVREWLVERAERGNAELAWAVSAKAKKASAAAAKARSGRLPHRASGATARSGK